MTFFCPESTAYLWTDRLIYEFFHVNKWKVSSRSKLLSSLDVTLFFRISHFFLWENKVFQRKVFTIFHLTLSYSWHVLHFTTGCQIKIKTYYYKIHHLSTSHLPFLCYQTVSIVFFFADESKITETVAFQGKCLCIKALVECNAHHFITHWNCAHTIKRSKSECSNKNVQNNRQWKKKKLGCVCIY